MFIGFVAFLVLLLIITAIFETTEEEEFYCCCVCFKIMLDGTSQITSYDDCNCIYVKNVKKFKKYCEKNRWVDSFVDKVGYYIWVEDCPHGVWEYVSDKRKDIRTSPH